ncbi:MAG: hypothetical protein ACK6C0_03235, partial [Betaproteobacteria bacterium]
FEAGAIDYVLKPVSAARLFATVARLKERLAAPPMRLEPVLNALPAATCDFRGRLQLKLKQRPEMLLVSDTFTHLFRQM